MSLVPNTNGYALLGSSPVSAYPFTMAAWFYVTNTLPNGQTMLSLGNTAGNGDWYLYGEPNTGSNDGVLYAGHQNTGGFAFAASSNRFSINQWNSAVGVFTSTTSRDIWLNGTKTNNATSLAFNAPNRVSIGATYRSGAPVAGAGFQGRIAEVAIWNVALTDAEATAYSKRFSPRRIRRSALKFHVPGIHEICDRVSGANFTAGTLTVPTGSMDPADHAPIIQ